MQSSNGGLSSLIYMYMYVEDFGRQRHQYKGYNYSYLHPCIKTRYN